MERNYQQEADDAARNLETLRGQYDPAAQYGPQNPPVLSH